MSIMCYSSELIKALNINRKRLQYICSVYKISAIRGKPENKYNVLDFVRFKIGEPSEDWIFVPSLDESQEGIYYGFLGDKETKIDVYEMFNL